ncbi:MAG: PASTA domain-containing protein [Bacteroidales bacterium]|nr:PASTA domain-containing protein [Bacteroidales bacterium]
MAVKGKVKRTGKGPGLLRHLIAAMIITVVLIAGMLILLNVVTRHNQEHKVPDLSNMSVSEAQYVAALAGMKVKVIDSTYVKRMRRGVVFRQHPVPGSMVKEGRCISLTINAVNAKQVTMPDLVGSSLRQAKSDLKSRGLVLGKLLYVQDMATNNVLRQLHGNREIEPGVHVESEAVIDLVVGLNSIDNTTYVPDVAGLRQISAIDAVHGHSLNIAGLVFDETVKDYEDSLNAMVYMQVPEPSDSIKVGMGDEVLLYLTLDQGRIPVKDEITPEDNK